MDIGLLIPACILIKMTTTGPGFVVKGLILVAISCIIDGIYQAASIYYTKPPFTIELFLYTLTGLDTFLDVSIYWIIAFMYWITAINIAEFNEERQHRGTEVSVDRSDVQSRNSFNVKPRHKEPFIFLTYVIILATINIIYIVATLKENPSNGPN